MTNDAQDRLSDVPTCPGCGDEIYGDTPEDREWYYEKHLGTLGHQVGVLGEAGRDLREKLARMRDDAIRRYFRS